MFLRDLKERCVTQGGNSAFWSEVSKFGRELGLITSKEAKKQGGESTVLEKEASEVCLPFS